MIDWKRHRERFGYMQTQTMTQANITAFAKFSAAVLALVISACAVWVSVTQIETMKDTARRQLRAYLLYESGELRQVNADDFEPIVHVRNTGSTPAYAVATSCEFEIADRNKPARTIFTEVGDPRIDLGRDFQYRLPDCQRLDAEAPAESERTAVYVYGFVNYRDIYQRCQSVSFTAKANLPMKEKKLELSVVAHTVSDPIDNRDCANEFSSKTKSRR
jgi:hypothetical protein